MLSLELRRVILDYLTGVYSLEVLEEQVVSLLPETIALPSSDDADATAAIELALAEWSDGLRAEDEVRDLLRKTLEQYETIHLDVDEGNPRISYRSVNKTSSPQRSLLGHSFSLTPSA